MSRYCMKNSHNNLSVPTETQVLPSGPPAERERRNKHKKIRFIHVFYVSAPPAASIWPYFQTLSGLLLLQMIL